MFEGVGAVIMGEGNEKGFQNQVAADTYKRHKAPNPRYQRQHWEHNYGRIPEDWGFVTLGSLFVERKEKSNDQKAFPLYSLTIEKGVTPKTERYERSFLLKDEESNEFSVVYPGDFVFNPMNLRFGAVAYSRESLPVLVSAYYNVLTPENRALNHDFMESLLRCDEVMDLYERIAIGSLVEKRRIHLSILNETYIPLPTINEQEAIGVSLSKWDRTIDLTERLIAAKQERRRWLSQQLLTGKRRLPSFSEPWRNVHLVTVFTNRIETNRADLPLVAITGENGVVSRDDLVRRDTSSEDKGAYLRICPGDIGYNTMRMWQGVCGLSKIEGIVSPAYTIVTPTDEVDGEFMALLFKSPALVHLFHKHSQGLVKDTLNLKWRHFAEIRVSIPKKAEQQAIAAVFRLADRELSLLRTQLDALRKQKKGLMQILLTGRVRVRSYNEARR
jgi:type I restriction enzyme, S subunit